jgi:hypothetical protein
MVLHLQEINTDDAAAAGCQTRYLSFAIPEHSILPKPFLHPFKIDSHPTNPLPPDPTQSILPLNLAEWQNKESYLIVGRLRAHRDLFESCLSGEFSAFEEALHNKTPIRKLLRM